MRQYALLAFFFSLFVLVSYVYHGFISPPHPGDSVDYHMPIAQDYLKGTVFTIPKNVNPFINFPGASESILSLFILLHIPVALFCVLGWVILFLLLRKMGMHFNLGSELSLIYATAFTSSLSVLREMDTQSIDMWMAVWFVLLVLLLENPKKTFKYFLLLGFVFGMLLGSKYTGIVYTLILLAVYGLRLIKLLNWSRILAFIVPFLLVGVSWYVRNLIARGDPLYPISFLFFPGDTHIQNLNDYILWKEVINGHAGIIFVALVSEYLIWGLSFIPFLFFFIKNLKKKFIDDKTTRVFWLCFLLFITSFFIYSFLPTDYHFVVSNMRYMYSVIIILMLAVFIMAKKFKYIQEIALLALFNSIATVSYIIYHPKLIIIYLVIASAIYLKGRKYLDRFISGAF
jgi:4-amino-4-deoxy-L-arabinose transferase-like glycosyltransferase